MPLALNHKGASFVGGLGFRVCGTVFYQRRKGLLNYGLGSTIVILDFLYNFDIGRLPFTDLQMIWVSISALAKCAG